MQQICLHNRLVVTVTLSPNDQTTNAQCDICMQFIIIIMMVICLEYIILCMIDDEIDKNNDEVQDITHI